jgi:formamidopyrimidine-DNA glycosylase
VPEIAEVEIVRRGLAALDGARVSRVEVLDHRLESLPVADVEGRLVVGATRHGKLLGLELDNGDILAFHLRMTGNLLLHADERARLRVHLERDGDSLCVSLVDPRRFGTVVLSAREHFAETSGPDLFDESLTGEVLQQRGGRSRRPIKAVLLDQQVVAGIGNYMADETLWEAKVSPLRPAHEIKLVEWRRLLKKARGVAERALERGGASFSDYRQTDGSLGGMQETFRVYGRAGLPCRRCKRLLEKTVVAGRGTTFCPTCQAESA